jgi:hypothetical protein
MFDSSPARQALCRLAKKTFTIPIPSTLDRLPHVHRKTDLTGRPSVIFSGQEIRTPSEGALRLDRSAYLQDHDQGTEFVEDAARVTGAAGGHAARVDLHVVR